MWHPKADGQIRNRDCFTNGEYSLVANKFAEVKVHIKNTFVTKVDVLFFNGATSEVICHLDAHNSALTGGEHKCEKHGIELTQASNTLNVKYPAADFTIAIQNNGDHYNVYVWQPQSLVDQSSGICTEADAGCSVGARETNDLGWEPVRSGSQRQFITKEQATSICNQYVDAFFTKIHRAPYQRDAKFNNVVANVLAGCIADVIFTGQIEVARDGLDVLMMEELTRDATTIDSIQKAIQSGIGAASFIVNDAAKMAEVGIRKVL
jgi:hypothetical protein